MAESENEADLINIEKFIDAWDEQKREAKKEEEHRAILQMDKSLVAIEHCAYECRDALRHLKASTTGQVALLKKIEQRLMYILAVLFGFAVGIGLNHTHFF